MDVVTVFHQATCLKVISYLTGTAKTQHVNAYYLPPESRQQTPCQTQAKQHRIVLITKNGDKDKKFPFRGRLAVGAPTASLQPVGDAL